MGSTMHLIDANCSSKAASPSVANLDESSRPVATWRKRTAILTPIKPRRTKLQLWQVWVWMWWACAPFAWTASRCPR